MKMVPFQCFRIPDLTFRISPFGKHSKKKRRTQEGHKQKKEKACKRKEEKMKREKRRGRRNNNASSTTEGTQAKKRKNTETARTKSGKCRVQRFTCQLQNGKVQGLPNVWQKDKKKETDPCEFGFCARIRTVARKKEQRLPPRRRFAASRLCAGAGAGRGSWTPRPFCGARRWQLCPAWPPRTRRGLRWGIQ